MFSNIICYADCTHVIAHEAELTSFGIERQCTCQPVRTVVLGNLQSHLHDSVRIMIGVFAVPFPRELGPGALAGVPADAPLEFAGTVAAEESRPHLLSWLSRVWILRLRGRLWRGSMFGVDSRAEGLFGAAVAVLETEELPGVPFIAGLRRKTSKRVRQRRGQAPPRKSAKHLCYSRYRPN